MARTLYVAKKFTPEHEDVIAKANAICAEFAGHGLVLTLRQLYYKFVARDLFPENRRWSKDGNGRWYRDPDGTKNADPNYNWLGGIMNDARLAGRLDWNYFTDITRNLLERRHWDSPQAMLDWAAEHYYNDLWKPQKRRVEVWIEKDAGIGVIQGVCSANDVPYFSCRGYTSVAALHEAAQRLRWYVEAGEQVLILHVGDHDPSGIDMTRDIEDRLRLFISKDWAGLHMGFGSHTRGAIRDSMRDHMRAKGSEIEDYELPWEVRRIALTLEQVERYNPPPDPAKTTDARYQRYFAETGLTESWELDALDPLVLQDLIQDHIDGFRDSEQWGDSVQEMEEARLTMKRLGKHWNTVRANLPEDTR